MRTYDLAFDGVTPIQMTIDHKFFLLLSDEGIPLDISLRKNGGFSEMKGLQAGFGLKLASDQRGKEFIFESAAAQTVKIFVGDDEAIYNRLSGTVTLNGGNITSITNTVKTQNLTAFTNSYKIDANLAANTAETVLLPSANVNGVIVHTANVMTVHPTAPTNFALIAKSSAPLSNIDGDVILSPNAAAVGQSGYVGTVTAGVLNRDIFISAGKGLYFIASVQMTNSRSVLFTVL